MDRHDGHGGPCEVCGGPSDTLVNCLTSADPSGHLHTLCERCDRYLSGDGYRWAGGSEPRCPDETTDADRVLVAMREAHAPLIFCAGLACTEFPDGRGRFCPSHGPGEAVARG